MMDAISGRAPAHENKMTRTEMEGRATEVAELLKTLSHPARLMLACTLAAVSYTHL